MTSSLLKSISEWLYCHVLVQTPVYSCGKNHPGSFTPLTLSAISDDLTLTGLGSVIVEGKRTRSICFRGSNTL